MGAQKLEKRRGDIRRYEFDCKQLLGINEEITRFVSVSSTPQGCVKNSENLEVSPYREPFNKTSVFVQISRGTVNEEYEVSVTFGTNFSDAVEVEGNIIVSR